MEPGKIREESMHTIPAELNKVHIRDSFWAHYQKLLRETVLPYQWEALNDNVPGAEPSHCIHNLKVAAGDIEGEFLGPVFQDHGIVTWLEAVGGSLAHHPDPELEALADWAVDLLGRVQREDGYLNSYFIVKAPDERWNDLMECHELFCAGHLIEAAVAYSKATGKDKFLNIAIKYADYIDSVFGPEEEKCKGYPGHEEIEIALLKLYRATGNQKYLKLSEYFVSQRGVKPLYFQIEREKRNNKLYWENFDMDEKYYQIHQLAKDQRIPVGHAVRGVYLYTAMAELAAETGNQELAEACYALFDHITQRQMYITGGIGSTQHGEAFTFDYDLPNDIMYQETCASIGLAFFTSRMLMLKHDAKYADVLERILYNSLLSGIARDGKSFFYVNPMEVWPEASEKNPNRGHVKAERQPWFACACCPPNIARTLASIGQYLYSSDEKGIYVNLYVGSTFDHRIGEQKVQLVVDEKYLEEGSVLIQLKTEQPVEMSLYLRRPGWCGNVTVLLNGVETKDYTVENGYLCLNRMWTEADRLELRFEIKVLSMRANPQVRADAGKIALTRGPLVYCLEETDNGENLAAISIPASQEFETVKHPDLPEGIPAIGGVAYRLDELAWENCLYAPIIKQIPVHFCAVPYALWGNRRKGEMQVWTREKL